MKTLLERFQEKYTPEPNGGCWIWTASVNNRGYGMFKVNGSMSCAHRASYELHVGEIGDKFVLHKCDNPVCVNPDHLFLGTHADNMADRNKKGRQARPMGEANGMAKLTEEDILAIRSDPRIGREIAADYGMGITQIHDIKARKQWAHI